MFPGNCVSDIVCMNLLQIIVFRVVLFIFVIFRFCLSRIDRFQIRPFQFFRIQKCPFPDFFLSEGSRQRISRETLYVIFNYWGCFGLWIHGPMEVALEWAQVATIFSDPCIKLPQNSSLPTQVKSEAVWKAMYAPHWHKKDRGRIEQRRNT